MAFEPNTDTLCISFMGRWFKISVAFDFLFFFGIGNCIK